MSGTKIATAYVQIAPTTKGISGKLKSLMGGEGDAAGKAGGESLAKSLMGKVTGALAAIGVGKAIGAAMNSGAALQQSIGGVETLYQKSANRVKKYAANAYREAGVSANTYMEQATTMAASLMESVGGKSKQAADLANMAIKDMADNSAKMGTDLQMLQNTYSGLSRGNFTMLDNLKLGFSGTKQGMEDLIKKANKLRIENGKAGDLSIKSYADMVEAIHEVQASMGIAGVAAQEADETFSGSFQSMKAAAENLLGYMTTGGDVEQAVKDLAQTASTFVFGNAIPMLFELGKSIPTAFSTAITTAVPIIQEQGAALIKGFTGRIGENLPEVIAKGADTVIGLIDGAAAQAPEFISKAGEILTSFAGTIGENLPVILVKGGEIVLHLAKGALGMLPAIGDAALNILHSFSTKFTAFDWHSVGQNIIRGIANGITSAASWIKDAAINAAKSAFNAVVNFWDIHSPSRKADKELGVMIPKGMARGIIRGIPEVERAMDAMNRTAYRRSNKQDAYPVPASTGIMQELGRIGNSGMQIVLDTGVLVGETVRQYDQALGKRASIAGKGLAYGV